MIRFAVLLLVGLAALPAQAREWRLLADESSLEFTFRQMGSPIKGRFRQFDATITFDPADPENARVEAEIGIDSIDTGNSERDQGIKAADWFDAVSFPTARFVSTGFAADGADLYEVTGELTVRDVTRTVVLPMTITVDGDRATASGSIELDRRDFGIGRGDWASDAAVGYPVILEISVAAEAAG